MLSNILKDFNILDATNKLNSQINRVASSFPFPLSSQINPPTL